MSVLEGHESKSLREREQHDFSETVDGQIGNSNRFFISETCGRLRIFYRSEYVTAKSVVSSYYGNVDNKSHTVTVSDLSDSGVHNKYSLRHICRKMVLTSAPNYTDAGYYPVYYEISYKYQGETMTENGVSYVWLLKDKRTITVAEQLSLFRPKSTNTIIVISKPLPSCDNLGYERWQCDGCGNLDKRNYTKGNRA